MYVERRSRVTAGTLWRSRPTSPAAVLPDGCMDLLWLDERLVVAGPDTRPEPAGAAREVVGLRFDPGIAPGLLDVPAHQLRDLRVPLSELWPAGLVRRWTEHVRRVGPLQALEECAAERQPEADDARELTLVAHLCRLDRPTAAVAATTGWSERTLHRRCLHAFGYGSKTLARVLRFQRATALLRTGRTPAEVAAETGYADQAHLTREISALAGLTPSQLTPSRLAPSMAPESKAP